MLTLVLRCGPLDFGGNHTSKGPWKPALLVKYIFSYDCMSEWSNICIIKNLQNYLHFWAGHMGGCRMSSRVRQSCIVKNVVLQSNWDWEKIFDSLIAIFSYLKTTFLTFVVCLQRRGRSQFLFILFCFSHNPLPIRNRPRWTQLLPGYNGHSLPKGDFQGVRDEYTWDMLPSILMVLNCSHTL